MADATTIRLYELQVKVAQESLNQMTKLNDAAKRAEAGFDSLVDKVKEVGHTLLGAFTVEAIVSQVEEAIKKVDELGAAAERVGIGVAEFSALAYAIEQTDSSVGDLEVGLKAFQKSLTEDTKGSKILDALGIDKTQAPLEALKDFADAFKTIHAPAVRAASLVEVFGKSGLQMRPLLEQGAKGITALMDSAKEFNAVIDEDTKRILSDLENEMRNTKKETDALSRSLAVGLAPALTDIQHGLQGAMKDTSAYEVVGTALGNVLRLVAAGGVLVAGAFNSVSIRLSAVGAVANAVVHGDLAAAGQAILDMHNQIDANDEAVKKRLEQVLGLALPTKELTKATDENTTSLKNNDAAIKKILAPPAAAKKPQITEFEKLTKALQDQIDAMKRATSETPEYDRAIKTLSESLAKLTPAQELAAETLLDTVRNTEQADIAAKKYKESQKELKDFLDSSRTAAQKFNDEFAKGQELILEHPEDREKILAHLDTLREKLFDGMKDGKKAVKDTTDLFGMLADKVDGYSQTIATALVDFATGAGDAKKSFSEMVNSVLRDIARMTTQILLIEPLMAGLKQWLNSMRKPASTTGTGNDKTLVASLISDALFAAKGGVYQSSSLSAFSGGVYDTPQVFKFAHGAGVFAEAGPEAIMPLTRGADGKLGVDTSGGGDVVVNVFNESKAQVTTSTRRDDSGRRVIELMVKDAVSHGFRSGAFDGVMGVTYGLNRIGVR